MTLQETYKCYFSSTTPHSPLLQNVRHPPRVKFHLCSLERLTVWIINLGPERRSSQLPTVDMIGPGASQGYGARKIKPRVPESGRCGNFSSHVTFPRLLRGRKKRVTQGGLRDRAPGSRQTAAPAEAAANPALTRMPAPSFTDSQAGLFPSRQHTHSELSFGKDRKL